MLDITPLNENPMHSPKLSPIDPIILDQVVNQIIVIDRYYFWRREKTESVPTMGGYILRPPDNWMVWCI